MADIQVFFENRGNPRNLNVIVLNDPQPVLEHEPVHWHFQAEKAADVDKVIIEFADTSATYFGASTRCERYLAEGDAIFGRPPDQRHTTDPEPDPGEPLAGHLSHGEEKQFRMRGYSDKYTITAWKNGEQVGIKDPEIVPIRPPSPKQAALTQAS